MISKLLKIIALCCFGLFGAGGCCRPLHRPGAENRTETIGFVFRHQFSADLYKYRMMRHVDLLLADGSLVGFHGTEKKPRPFYVFRAYPGVVRRKEWHKAHRPWHVEVEAARTNRINGRLMPLVSTWVKLSVTPEQAAALANAWKRMEADPPSFRLMNRNCVTRAVETLVEAGIFAKAVPGLEMPRNMMGELFRLYGNDLPMETGFFGYRGGRPFLLPLDPQPAWSWP